MFPSYGYGGSGGYPFGMGFGGGYGSMYGSFGSSFDSAGFPPFGQPAGFPSMPPAPFFPPQQFGGFPPSASAPRAAPPAPAPAPAAATTAPPPVPPAAEEKVDGPRAEELTLGYWSARGTAAPIRMLLAYNGSKYANKYFDARRGDDGVMEHPQWDEERSVLRGYNPLITLPYLVSVEADSIICLAQANAILAHIGRKACLTGCSEIDAAKSDMLVEQCSELRKEWCSLTCGGHESDFAADCDAYFGAGGVFPTIVAKFEEWFDAQGSEFLVEDDHPITADFLFWELLDIHSALRPGCIDSFPRVAAFYAKFRADEHLKEYFASEQYALPINPPHSRWIGESAAAEQPADAEVAADP